MGDYMFPPSDPSTVPTDKGDWVVEDPLGPRLDMAVLLEDRG